MNPQSNLINLANETSFNAAIPNLLSTAAYYALQHFSTNYNPELRQLADCEHEIPEHKRLDIVFNSINATFKLVATGSVKRTTTKKSGEKVVKDVDIFNDPTYLKPCMKLEKEKQKLLDKNAEVEKKNIELEKEGKPLKEIPYLNFEEVIKDEKKYVKYDTRTKPVNLISADKSVKNFYAILVHMFCEELKAVVLDSPTYEDNMLSTGLLKVVANTDFDYDAVFDPTLFEKQRAVDDLWVQSYGTVRDRIKINIRNNTRLNDDSCDKLTKLLFNYVCYINYRAICKRLNGCCAFNYKLLVAELMGEFYGLESFKIKTRFDYFNKVLNTTKSSTTTSRPRVQRNAPEKQIKNDNYDDVFGEDDEDN